jgi:hypothetical protein
MPNSFLAQFSIKTFRRVPTLMGYGRSGPGPLESGIGMGKTADAQLLKRQMVI